MTATPCAASPILALRLQLAYALLRTRGTLTRRAKRAVSLHGLRRARQLGWPPRLVKASRLCFSAAERLRTEAVAERDLRVALALYRAAMRGGLKSMRRRAQARVLLMLCQQGETTPELRRHLRGGHYVCRLATAVLRYSVAPLPELPEASQPRLGVSRALDGTLPAGMLRKLQRAFAPSSPFWSEHSYVCGRSPFFSYVHSLQGAPRTGFDRVLRLLLQRAKLAGFASAASAKYAEWWAHCRPHGTGHPQTAHTVHVCPTCIHRVPSWICAPCVLQATSCTSTRTMKGAVASATRWSAR